ncbi:apoptosis regulator BAX-like isoform 2-T2 [Pholidichthys leucotaenia]
MECSPEVDDEGIKKKLLELGKILLKDFIYKCIQRYADRYINVVEEQLDVEELTDPKTQRISQCLQQFQDEVDGNPELQRMINNPRLTPSLDMFLQVAFGIFSDGKFNWARVVALFFFASQLIIKALLQNAPDFMQTIISWTMDFIQKHVISWIREQGGWEGVCSHFSTPTWQTVGVFLAGVLTTLLVTYRT